MFADVTNVVCARFDTQSLSWTTEDKREFLWSDIHTEQRGSFFSGDRYIVTSMYTSQIFMSELILFYLLLAWYCDNVIAANRGVPKPWLFFLSPNYWLSFFSSG